MTNIYDELNSLILTNLKLNCPVMSGNMQSHIDVEESGDGYTRVVISGPSYDINKWKKTGAIILTNEYDYAASVNEKGAFEGRSKKSRHWANKSILAACKAIASVYGAEVIINVEL